MVMQLIPQAEKPSTEVSSRHLRNRTWTLQNVGAAISDNQMDVHMVEHLKGKDKEERELLIREALGKELVLELPEEQTLTMKDDVGMSWFALNKLRRYTLN